MEWEGGRQSGNIEDRIAASVHKLAQQVVAVKAAK